jgi:hypothetical protein
MSYMIKDSRAGDRVEVVDAASQRISLAPFDVVAVSCTPQASDDRPGCLEELDEVLVAAILRFSGLCFFAITPFTATLRADSTLSANVTDELLGSAIGYIPCDEATVRAHLSKRRGATFEEWVVGSCYTHFVRPSTPKWYQHALYWNADLLFTQFSHVQCLSTYFGETREVEFYTRPFTGLDALIDHLPNAEATERRR